MKTFFNKLGKLLRKYNELLTLPLAILLWIQFPKWILMVDPQATFYSLEVLQVFLFAVIGLFFFTFIGWVYLRIVFPKGYELLDDVFTNDKLTPWQKTICVLSFFYVLLYCLVHLAGILA